MVGCITRANYSMVSNYNQQHQTKTDKLPNGQYSIATNFHGIYILHQSNVCRFSSHDLNKHNYYGHNNGTSLNVCGFNSPLFLWNIYAMTGMTCVEHITCSCCDRYTFQNPMDLKTELHVYAKQTNTTAQVQLKCNQSYTYTHTVATLQVCMLWCLENNSLG